MRNLYKSIFYITAAIVLASCAKAEEEGANVAAKRYFDAWMTLLNQQREENGLPKLNGTWNDEENANGIYVYKDDEIEGTGETVEKDGYAIVEYKAYDLLGNISEYTGADIAKQLGEYDPAKYYGPQVWLTHDGAIASGIQNALVGMKVGGSKKFIIPSWLMSYSSYSSAEEYLKHSTNYSNTIYDITVKDFTDSIDVWQIDSIKRYIVENFSEENAFSNDTTGYFFRRDMELPSSAKDFPSDTSIYINYTGKLLNGLVFDTTDEKTAKDNNIYSSSRSYEPVKITWGEEFNEITMGTDGSSVISGFAMTIWRMKYDTDDTEWKDECTGIFYSPLGYGYSGSGSSIPGYSPLIFEIKVADKPE